MTEEEFINLTKNNLGLIVTQEQLDLLNTYCEYLIDCNKKVVWSI